MKHENTRALYDYWNGLRADRAAPYRSELDPRAIAGLLESTFILEHGQHAAPRFRLAGTRLCDQFGMELRGMSALSLWHGEGRAEIRELLRGVVATPGVGLAACTVETRGGFLFEAEFLFLPLYSDLGVMNRILGCGYYMGGRETAVASPSTGQGAGQEPVHHWVDRVSLTPVDGSKPVGPRPSAPVDTSDGPLFGPNPLAGRFTPIEPTRPGDASRRRASSYTPSSKIAEIAAGARARRKQEPRPPLLYAIDGGMRDQNAVSRLAQERARDAAKAEGADRPTHLRLVSPTSDPSD